jgi:hypothetical protein
MRHKTQIDQERMEITAPVLVPDEVDYHGDIYDAEAVYKACRNYQANCRKAYLQHSFEIGPETSEFVEHYVTPADMTIATTKGDVLVKKGTWLATMKFKNPKLWQSVKQGKYTGFSIGGRAKSIEIEKSKVSGRKAAEEGTKVKNRLFDFDFSLDHHHVSLVDEAANATEVLVLKAKDISDIPSDINIEQKEDDMSLEDKKVKKLLKAKVEADAKIEELEKAKEEQAKQLEEVEKAKADLESANSELEKAKEEQAKQLEEVEKARVAKAKEVAVEKAKSLKADDADKFGEILYKCKELLVDEEYETLVKQLEKLSNIEDNAEFLKNKGEAEGAEDKFDKSDEILKRRQKYISEDGLAPREASKKARLEVEAELASK